MIVEKKVDSLEKLVNNLATKEDIATIVAILNTGTGIYKAIICLGIISASVTSIVIGLKSVLLKVVS